MINRRGQVTIFVIIAIVIVAAIALMFLFPQVNVFVSDVDPSGYLRDCIEPEVENAVEVLAKQGGYINPDNFVMYQGNKIQYLCYTSENYIPCVVQQPLLVGHVQKEIENHVQPIARQCVQNLEDRYESQGYNVQTTPGEVTVGIVQGKVVVDFASQMTVEKESVQTFRKFAVALDSEFYDLLALATNIIQFESTLGDSETNVYISHYPDLKIDKIKRNGDTIYKLGNVVTGDEFTFASRSLVWPQGFS